MYTNLYTEATKHLSDKASTNCISAANLCEECCAHEICDKIGNEVRDYRKIIPYVSIRNHSINYDPKLSDFYGCVNLIDEAGYNLKNVCEAAHHTCLICDHKKECKEYNKFCEDIAQDLKKINDLFAKVPRY